MTDLYKLEIVDKSDLEHVKAHCTCGELDFEGDWDELCELWFKHEADPKYATKIDHEPYLLLSREALKRVQELWPEMFAGRVNDMTIDDKPVTSESIFEELDE